MLSQNSPLEKNDSDKRHMFRMQAIDEIINSERAYLKKLEILMKYFIEPLKEEAIITESSHTKLFGQVEMIYNLNGELLNELEENALNVAKAILKMAPFLKLYSVYAFDYKNALLTLQNLTIQNPVFRKFLQNNESRPEVQTKLNSLMIEPIQRVPRYKLLLEQILFYTSPADPNYKMIKESIKVIESTCSHINSVIEDQEVTQMLINLQNSLINRSPSIVKPSREVIKEGILNKVTRNGTQIQRYCVLMSDIFMYCKILKDRSKNTLVENSLECCCIFPLKKCKVYEMFPGSFKIRCQDDGIILCTTDHQAGLNWSATLKDAIDLHIECRKTLRKESSKRKPIRSMKAFDEEVAPSIPFYKLAKARKIFQRKPAGMRQSVKPSTKKSSADDYDPSYGFANRMSGTRSYIRAHNVDLTIPLVVSSNEFLNVSKSNDILYPLRSGGGRRTNGIFAQSINNKENAIGGIPPPKKVKFDDSPNLRNVRAEKPPPFSFSKSNNSNFIKPTLRQRITDFFSSFF